MSTSPKTPSATNEELLGLVIASQVKGGCNKWLEMDKDTRITPEDGSIVSAPSRERISHVLEVLLCTKGCKAAYGEWGGIMADPAIKTCKYIACSLAILRAWHSGQGNNVRAALETAVSFLPKL